ncbi:MAG: protein translocase SEC61 complex subunit gamma [Thermoprotei archaeon]|nr:MAG: protein translocase SEC61 complex subunit gamma [Thermoprotei archaeon]HDJ97220.1 protein translocase SEC61 complex subunit gamma [Thermofilum sp.]
MNKVGIKSFLRDTARVVRLTKKPEKSQFLLTLRVVAIGLGILGAAGYIFQLIGTTLRGVHAPTIPRDIALAVLAATVAAILGVALYLRRRAT